MSLAKELSRIDHWEPELTGSQVFSETEGSHGEHRWACWVDLLRFQRVFEVQTVFDYLLRGLIFLIGAKFDGQLFSALGNSAVGISWHLQGGSLMNLGAFLTSAAEGACEGLLTVLHADTLGAGVGCRGLNLGTEPGEPELLIPEAVW